MAGDEVGVEVGFDDVLDLEVLLACVVEVDVDVALGVDDGGDALRGDYVRGVREAAEEELFDDYRFHVFTRDYLMILLDWCCGAWVLAMAWVGFCGVVRGWVFGVGGEVRSVGGVV